MKPSELKEFLKIRVAKKIKRAVLIEAMPGVGKTQIAAQVAAELGIAFIHLHAPNLLPEDMGLPIVNKERNGVDFVVPFSKFPLEGSNWPDQGILLIDELPQADNNAQKILANLIQEREIHGHKLKPGWTIFATGNRAKDRAGANRVLSHLGNRVSRIGLDVSIDDWTLWALDNEVKTEVISFIRFRPELLAKFDANVDVNATPRAWVEGVSAQLGEFDSSLEFEAFSGDVGEGPASEFLAFLKIYRNLPDVDGILLNPSKADLVKDPATTYALVGALVNKTTKGNFGKALTYIKRLPPEYSVLFVKQAMQKDKSITSTKDFIAWASNEGADLLN